mmetsp:Transcript_3620/g.6190  ORF Transcript_3620/g.6190 Transcript_3620/m.6190 type:complete len:501 (+) Transcript_3620:159-1661(+)
MNSDTSSIRHRKLTHTSSGHLQTSPPSRQHSHSPPRQQVSPPYQHSQRTSPSPLSRQSSHTSEQSHSPPRQQTSPQAAATQPSTSISRTWKQMYSNASSMTFSDLGDDDEEEEGDRHNSDKFNSEQPSVLANKSLSFEDRTFIPHGATGSARLRNLGRMNSRLLSDLNQTHRGPTFSFQRRAEPDNDSNTTSPEAKALDGNVSPRNANLHKQRSSRMSMNMSNRISVGVKMKVKLDYIDDVNQEIHTEVFLSMHYRCWKAEEFVSGQNGFVALAPEEYPDIYVPMVEFLNFRNCEHIEGFRLLVNTMSGVVYIYRVYRVVFRGLLKLDRFPFDRQIINIELKSFTAMLVPWSMPESDVPYGIRADELWCKHDVVVECDGSLWELNWTRGMVHQATNPSMYIASFGIERISLFYVTNFFLVTFFRGGIGVWVSGHQLQGLRHPQQHHLHHPAHHHLHQICDGVLHPEDQLPDLARLLQPARHDFPHCRHIRELCSVHGGQF